MIGKEISHYKIESEIGRGGMGIVYKALDTTLGRTVAMKFLPPSHHADEAAEARFVHEAKSISALDHPNIAVVHQIGEAENGQLYIVMGYYTGETLEEIIARGPLEISKVEDYSRQIAAGLQCAHEKGITHRDVKPGNVIVTGSGLLKILDFGLAKVQDVTMTAENLSVGTPAYISPEQSTGQPFDHRVDLWALGVVMFEMLTGTRPFTGAYASAVAYGIVNEQHGDLRELRPDAPEELCAVVDKLLQKNPEDRYQTAGEVVVELSDGLSSIDIQPAAEGDAADPAQTGSSLFSRDGITNLISRDSITKTVIEVVPKKVVGFAGRLFYSVAVSLIAVVIGYFFQDYFLGKKSPPPEVAVVDSSGVGREAARGYLESGIEKLGTREYDIALAEIEKAIEADSGYAAAWTSKSAAYLQLQNFPEAITAGRRALSIDSTDDGAYYNLGFALAEMGQLDDAMEAFDKATQFNVTFTRAYSVWGDLLIENERPEEALTVLERGRRTPKGKFHFLIDKNIGKAYINLEDYSTAVEYLESSLDDTKWPETMWLLGQAYEELGRKDDARKQYEDYLAVERDPKKKSPVRERLNNL